MNPAAGRLKSSHSSTTTSQLSIQRITLQTSFLSSIRSEFGLALSSFARMLPIASSCASAASVMPMLSWQRSVNCPTRCSCAGIFSCSICIAKRKPRVEYSQVFNPWLSMSVLLLHRYPDVPRGCSLWSSSLKEPAVFSLLLKQYTLRSLEYIWRIGFR